MFKNIFQQTKNKLILIHLKIELVQGNNANVLKVTYAPPRRFMVMYRLKCFIYETISV